jgi:hypothetical protein
LREKKIGLRGSEVDDCLGCGTVYVEDGDLRDGKLVEEELGLPG